jgi:hypothetical protein
MKAGLDRTQTQHRHGPTMLCTISQVQELPGGLRTSSISETELEARSNVDMENLADCLIANTSGPGSIGQIYRFLCQHHNAGIARDEFIRFLKGEQSELLLRQARQATGEARDDLLVASETFPAPTCPSALQNQVS